MCWLDKVNKINNDPNCLMDLHGVGIVTVAAFQSIIKNENNISTYSLESTCNDIKKKVQEYNSKNKKEYKI